MQETWVWSLGWEDPLEKEMATHSSIAWRIPWTERGAWQTSAHGVTRVKHDLATKPPPQSWNTGHRSYLMFWERPNKWLRTPLGPRRQAASLDCKPLPFKPRTAERKVLCFSVAQSHLTLCDPLDCSPPGSSVHGIFQARTREWVAISSSRGVFLTQGSNLHLLHWQADSLPLSHQGSSRESPNVNWKWDPVSNKPFGHSFASTISHSFHHGLSLVTICPYSNSPLSRAPNELFTPLGHLLLPAGPLAGHAQRWAPVPAGSKSFFILTSLGQALLRFKVIIFSPVLCVPFSSALQLSLPSLPHNTDQSVFIPACIWSLTCYLDFISLTAFLTDCLA